MVPAASAVGRELPTSRENMGDDLVDGEVISRRPPAVVDVLGWLLLARIACARTLWIAGGATLGPLPGPLPG